MLVLKWINKMNVNDLIPIVRDYCVLNRYDKDEDEYYFSLSTKLHSIGTMVRSPIFKQGVIVTLNYHNEIFERAVDNIAHTLSRCLKLSTVQYFVDEPYYEKLLILLIEE